MRQDDGTLTDRLLILEREMRWWKRGTVLLLLLLTVATLIGSVFQGGNVFEGQRILLKDSEGRVRVFIGDWGWGTDSIPMPGEPRYEDLSFPLPARDKPWGVHLFATDGTYLAGLKTIGLTKVSDGTTTDNGWLIIRDMTTESRIDLSAGGSYVDLDMRASAITHEQGAIEAEASRKKFNSAKSSKEREEAHLLKTPPRKQVRLFATEDQAQFSLSENNVPRLALGQTVLGEANGVTSHRPLSSIVLFNDEGHVIRAWP